MQRNEIIIVLKKLKIAYPRFYADMSKEDAQNTIVLWEDMFKEEDDTFDDYDLLHGHHLRQTL